MKKSIQKINYHPDKELGEKYSVHHMLMPTIRCLCGSEILVVPNLKAMDIAITKHVANHKHSRDDPKKLTNFLTEQVLIKASKIQTCNNYK